MSAYTEIVVLLDRSGSMQTARSDHEGGLNSFVADQRDLEGDTRFTLIQFDTEGPCEIVHDGAPIAEVGTYTLVPRGGTPLLDALGRSVAHVRTRLDAQTRKPDMTIFMVITDGEENQSREFTKAQVKSLIEEREKAGWRFLFLGAGIDAFAEAGGVGIHGRTTLTSAAAGQGLQASYGATLSNVRSARRALVTAQANERSVDMDAVYANLDYTDEQRKAAVGGTAGSSSAVVTTGSTTKET